MSQYYKSGPAKGLTAQQRKFLDYYRLDPELNASRAYKRAYPNAGVGTSRVNACRMLTTAKAQNYLAAMAEKESGEIGVKVTVERIIEELKRAAFFNPKHLFNDDGSLIPLSELPDWVARAIGGIKVKHFTNGKDGDEELAWDIIEIKLVSKERTLELLGKHLVMFTERFKIESEEEMRKRVHDEMLREGEEVLAAALHNMRALGQLDGKNVSRMGKNADPYATLL